MICTTPRLLVSSVPELASLAKSQEKPNQDVFFFLITQNTQTKNKIPDPGLSLSVQQSRNTPVHADGRPGITQTPMPPWKTEALILEPSQVLYTLGNLPRMRRPMPEPWLWFLGDRAQEPWQHAHGHAS